MAVHTYVVRLVDVEKSTNYGVSGDAKKVGCLLSTWYTAVCHKASGGDATWNADVQWMDDPPRDKPPNDNAGAPFVINMMIYFLLTPRTSVIKLHPSNNNRLPDPGVWSDTNDIGLTWFLTMNGAVTIDVSEVYVSRCRELTKGDDSLPLLLARTAFHESMHNQLALDNRLHRFSGFAAADATGTSPTADNIDKMAASIATLRKQWVDGFQAWRTDSTNIPRN